MALSEPKRLPRCVLGRNNSGDGRAKNLPESKMESKFAHSRQEELRKAVTPWARRTSCRGDAPRRSLAPRCLARHSPPSSEYKGQEVAGTALCLALVDSSRWNATKPTTNPDGPNIVAGWHVLDWKPPFTPANMVLGLTVRCTNSCNWLASTCSIITVLHGSSRRPRRHSARSWRQVLA